MSEYRKRTGALLRIFRTRCNQTLEQAAPAFNLSPAALSRRERGLERIPRADIRAAIRQYELNQWEKYELWRAAGLIPDTTSTSTDFLDWQHLIESTLKDVGYPAWLVDQSGYVIAWNSCMERLLKLQQAATQPEPPYILDVMIFSERARMLYGAKWEEEAKRALAYWYHRTLFLAGDPVFNELLQRVRQRNVSLFDQVWDALQSEDNLFNLLTDGRHRVHADYETEGGMIRFIIMETPVSQAAGSGLFVFLPLGAESRTTYQEFCADEPSETHFLQPLDAT
jgi:transcriptional regulator with XRE-family HTH domain